LDETHDPDLRTWAAGAEAPSSDWPIQNLPLGVFRRPGDPMPHIGMAVGSSVLDLAGCRRQGLFRGSLGDVGRACAEPALNALMALGPGAWSALRRQGSAWLRADSHGRSEHRSAIEPLLVEASRVEMLLPAAIGDYTDFYASIYHATNVGSMFRPDEPLLPNYKYVPIGYHGRASSIVPSGTDVRRPSGQLKPESAAEPQFGASRRLDFELEVGAFIGAGNPLGVPISIQHADEQIFGLVLVNDWSARDVQAWEYQPLGPFLAKNFATTISPWIVTRDALEPFRVPGPARSPDDPQPLPYLDSGPLASRAAVDVRLEVTLSTSIMRESAMPAHVVSRSALRHLYWTFGQMIAHHASGGCNLRPGDLLASGTVSGPTRESRGCLLEAAWRGTEPLALPSGETRRFLEDGDTVLFRAWCERPGAVRIGFGECRGTVAPARE
jgi:fumarylacetoacetase